MIDTVYVGYWFWGRPTPYQLSQDRQQLFKRTKVDSDPTTAEARAAVAAGQIPAPAKRRKARAPA